MTTNKLNLWVVLAVGGAALVVGCSDDSAQTNNGRCGDGVLDPGEVCDGESFGDDSCASRDYYRGSLTCAADCLTATEEGCEGTCGDGVVDPEEACDPQATLTETCESLGYYSGTLSCLSTCNAWNHTECGGTCGDGILNGGELCDGDNFGSSTCESLGYLGGTLTCDATCVRSESGCCGDGTLGGGEECDDTNATDWDGCNTCEIFEMLVNTDVSREEYATGTAMAPDGSFVVVFDRYNPSNWNVRARRYDALGLPLGDEFLVHTDTDGRQSDSCIAMNAQGSFVVGWWHYPAGGGDSELRVQRFTASGSPSGSIVVVASGLVADIDLDMTSDGGFVATWLDFSGSGDVIRARRYNSSGTPVGSILAVSTDTTTTKNQPRVATLDNDSFVVAWTSYGDQDGDGLGVFGQRFDDNNAPLGSEFLVNPYVMGDQSGPAVAKAPDNEFIIAWDSEGEDGSGSGVYYQRYDASGSAIGQHSQANVYTADNQGGPTVAVSTSGSFVIGWRSAEQDGSSSGAYARLFDPLGNPTSGEIQLNRHTDGLQTLEQVSASPAGAFVAVWTDWSDLDGNEQGVFMQRFDSQGTAIGVGAFSP